MPIELSTPTDAGAFALHKPIRAMQAVPTGGLLLSYECTCGLVFYSRVVTEANGWAWGAVLEAGKNAAEKHHSSRP